MNEDEDEEGGNEVKEEKSILLLSFQLVVFSVSSTLP